MYPICQFGVKTMLSVWRCNFESVEKCESGWSKEQYVCDTIMLTNEVGASQLAEACRIYCSPIPAWIRNSCRRFDRVTPVFFRAKIVIDRGRVFLMPANRINCNHCSRAICQWVSDLLGWSCLPAFSGRPPSIQGAQAPCPC